MTKDTYPRLIFDETFDERARFEAKARGYLSHVKVVLSDESAYPVVFYDCARLGQELAYEVSSGRMCVADIGMIVLAEVTVENMDIAVRKLAREGFFKGLRSEPPSQNQ
jgi:hypothetical protein